jgi:UDP-MurNAc hydroxylase
MKITLIGHACYFIETEDLSILTDPAFFDPWGRVCVSCPKREVNIEKLPKPDLLVITHEHVDHCDPRSIAALNRGITVLRPDSRLLEAELTTLGFLNQKVLGTSKVRKGNTELISTFSDQNEVKEFGLIVADREGTMWNQVDTVVTKRTYNYVHPFPHIHVLFFPWQPFLQTNLVTGAPFVFPLNDYRGFLELAASVNADLNVPGACGFRYPDEFQWINRKIFPISHTKVAEDFPRFSKQTVSRMLPGDVIIIEKSKSWIEKQASPFVHTAVDDVQRLEFIPSAETKPIDWESDPTTKEDIQRITSYCEGITKIDVPGPLQTWKPSYRIRFLFHGESIQYDIDLTEPSPILRRSDQTNPAQLTCQIWGPAFAKFLRGECVAEELGFLGRVRVHGSIYEVSPRASGIMPLRNSMGMFWMGPEIEEKAFLKFVEEHKKK